MITVAGIVISAISDRLGVEPMDAGGGLCPGEGTEPELEPEVLAIKEVLRSQQQLLQKLYADLDNEREASATAAREALSMILRLQGEKAAVKMEADQYRRVAEERTRHAERALEVFEDVIHQKDMEIASLEFQVLAYRYKLMSMGWGGDLGVGENRFPESLLYERFDLYGWGSKESGANVRRTSSLSPMCSKDIHRKKDDDVEENRFGNLENKDPKPFGEQIKLPGIQAEELSNRNDSFCSMEHRTEADCVEYSDAVITKEAHGNAGCAVSVHDVFEVPGIGLEVRYGYVRPLDEGDDNRLQKSDADAEAHSGWMKDVLVSLNNDKVHAKSREITCASGDDKDETIREIGDAETRDEVRALSDSVERLEKERSRGSEGIVREQMKTVNEIKEQLSLILGEMRHWLSKNNARQHSQPSLLPLQEAMLHFWL